MIRHRRHVNIYTDEWISVPDALFSTLCGSALAEARELSAALPEVERARFALFGSPRTHLLHHGRAIASACSQASLFMEGGEAGYVLHSQVNAGPETWGVQRIGGNQISLAISAWERKP